MHVWWSGGEEWNSGKVGCMMEMTTSAGSWSLSPQDQSLTKCTQNRSLEDLSMGIQLPFQEGGSEGSSFLCTCMWPSSCNRVKRVAPAQTWWRWQWHCRGGYVGEDFLTGPQERSKRRWESFRRLKCMSDMIRISSADTVENYPHTLSRVNCIPTKCQIIIFM